MSNGKKLRPGRSQEPEEPEEEHLDFHEFEDEAYVEDSGELAESEGEKVSPTG